jgi:cobalamin-dependent methionine synthase I
MREIKEYSIAEVAPYISWSYFFHAWGFQRRHASLVYTCDCPACSAGWVNSFDKEERPKAVEAQKLYQEAQEVLRQLDGKYKVKTVFRLCHAASDGDDLLLDIPCNAASDSNDRPTNAAMDGNGRDGNAAMDSNGRDGLRFPLLRQQTRSNPEKPFLCLSDFIRPLSKMKEDEKWPDVANTVGVFASTVDADMECLESDDPYKHLLIQTLSDRLAEAATEKMHEYVRKQAWGYVPDEHLRIPELLIERFQGIRPAVGYPSLPDQSVNFLIDELINMKEIGIALTENGAMRPHASVCGLMFAHPAAEYFAVGKIGDDQLNDYSRRRGIPTETMRKFLAANL